MITTIFQIQNRQQFLQISLVRLLIIQQQRKNHILFHRQLRDKVKRLKDKADIPAAKYRQFSVIHGKNVLTINQHLSRSWHIQRTDHIKQCAFTRTRFSDDCHIFSLRNRKANIPKRFYSSFTAAIGLTNILDL